MNLYDKLKSNIEQVNDMERILEKSGMLSPKLKKHIENQRYAINEMQYILFQALSQQFPCHSTNGSYDMFENYIFEIKVTPRIKNEYF